MSLLTCESLSVGYDGKPVLSPLDFTVEVGDFLAVVGENGAGKSTLLRTLLGLQPPIGGKILWGDGLVKNEVGYLPQQTPAQKDFPASVREIVRSGCAGTHGLFPFYRKEEKERADAAMKKMHIDDLASRCYRELSGGQMQRVLLARALVATRKMLLLDEPTTGLDPKVSADLYALTKALSDTDKIAVVMITHDIRGAMRYAKHILHIGKTVFYGLVAEYLHTPIGRFFSEGGGEEDA